jgi:hypothetical protein
MFSMASDARIKGSVMRELALWYERNNGPYATAALASRLPADLASLVDPKRPALGLLASTWYPCALAHTLCDRAMEGATDEGRALAREANRDIVPRMIRGIYKVLYQSVASPELYAKHVGRQWHKLHTTGERTFVIRAEGQALSTIRSWDGHHPLLCWMMIYTMASLFEAMRFTDVTVDRLSCVGHGASECSTVLRWK